MIATVQLCFRIGDFALTEVSMQVARGQYFVLLGPPGSGKSIFLECLCGLHRTDAGRIELGEREVTHWEPRRRGVGYVPQDYALFPHLSVEKNIAFGLRHQGLGRNEIRGRVTETSDMLGIGALARRRINGLSGGERQRVALARALVLRPQVLLLDEPVSALDESTRQEVCEYLLGLHRQLSLTTIHVSHNQEEAFSIADQAGILQAGRLKQVGTMDQLLRQPRDEFVARFLRCENIFTAKATGMDGPLTRLECGAVPIHVPGRREGMVSFMIRPEDVQVRRADSPLRPADNPVTVKLVRARDFGNHVRLTLEGDLNLVAHVPFRAFGELGLGSESRLTASLPADRIYVFPAKGE